MKKSKDKYGILLYSLILLSYFIFGIAWVGVANLRGNADGGWLATYFNGNANKVVEQIVNYVISFMGGIGSILAGHFLVKFGHKYAVIISISLISIAIIAPWLHQDVEGSDYLGFALFIIARLFMSLGGTIVIIYIQPIIARYINDRKIKTKLSAITPLGYNAAVIISYLIISISPQVSQALFNNWQLVTACFALPIIPLLILYWIKAENFQELPNPENGQEKSWTMKDAFKDKRVLILSGIYMIWIIIAIIPIYLFPTMFSGLNDSFTSGTVADKTPYLGYFNWGGLYIICFMSGVLIGMFTVAAFNKTKYQRKWFMIGMFFLAILSFLGSILCAMKGNEAIWGTLFFGLLSGIVLWGMQGLIWTIPFELKNQTPQKIGLTFSAMSAIGYFGLTIANIILAILCDSTIISGSLTALDQTSQMEQSAVIFASCFLAISLLSIPLILFLPKSHFSKEQK